VNEVYVRINGSRTVDISEPAKEDCALCNTTEVSEHPLSPEEAEALNATYQGASEDGSRVYFLSKQRLLPGASGVNLYEYDSAKEPGARVALVATNMPEAGSIFSAPGAGVVRVSEDGSHVYFVSENDELARNRDGKGKTAKEVAEAGGGAFDLYLFNTATRHYVFIAPLSGSDSSDWQVRDERAAAATPDGRYLVIASVNDLTPDASGAGTQLYRIDAQTAEADAALEESGGSPSTEPIARITVGSNGLNNDGNAIGYAQMVSPSFVTAAYAAPEAIGITNDGSRVFFESPWGLTPQALNDVCVAGYEVEGQCEAAAEPAENVYEWENGEVHLLSDGKDRNVMLGSSAVTLIGASESGEDVFITSADPLVPFDTDHQADLYDARVDGGFAAPAAPMTCENDACRASTGAAPVFAGPATAAFAGPGNLPAPQSSSRVTKSEPSTRLTRALKVCRAEHDKRRRRRCESRARHVHGSARNRRRGR
jgi:hypothetical protein